MKEGLEGKRIVGGNSGYVGYSMSKRAAAAYEDGKLTYSKLPAWAKRAVDAELVSTNEWHHTSVYGNKTPFYSISQFDILTDDEKKELKIEDWDDILDFTQVKKNAQKVFDNKSKSIIKSKNNVKEIRKEFIKKAIKQLESFNSKFNRFSRITIVPKYGIVEEREMNGKHGWFNSEGKYYSMTEYYSGTDYETLDNYNEVERLRSNLKDAEYTYLPRVILSSIGFSQNDGIVLYNQGLIPKELMPDMFYKIAEKNKSEICEQINSLAQLPKTDDYFQLKLDKNPSDYLTDKEKEIKRGRHQFISDEGMDYGSGYERKIEHENIDSHFYNISYERYKKEYEKVLKSKATKLEMQKFEKDKLKAQEITQNLKELFEGENDNNILSGSNQYGTGKNPYIALYKGKRIELYADSSLQAQQKAASIFKAKKSYDVIVGIADDSDDTKQAPAPEQKAKPAQITYTIPSEFAHTIAEAKAGRAELKNIERAIAHLQNSYNHYRKLSGNPDINEQALHELIMRIKADIDQLEDTRTSLKEVKTAAPIQSITPENYPDITLTVGEIIYDTRYADFYTIQSIKLVDGDSSSKTDPRIECIYQKRGKTEYERASGIAYNIKGGSHIQKKEQPRQEETKEANTIDENIVGLEDNAWGTGKGITDKFYTEIVDGIALKQPLEKAEKTVIDGYTFYVSKINTSWKVIEPKSGLPVSNRLPLNLNNKKAAIADATQKLKANGGIEKVPHFIDASIKIFIERNRNYVENYSKEKETPKQTPKAAKTPGTQSYFNHNEAIDFTRQIINNHTPENRMTPAKIRELALKTFSDPVNDRIIRELVELAQIDLHYIAVPSFAEQKDKDLNENLNKLFQVYKTMPTFQMRDSNTSIMQQFSTPIYIGWILSNYCTIGKNRETVKVFEPSAGNGLLVSSYLRKQVTANELDPARNEILRFAGYSNVMAVDASKPFAGIGKEFDIVVTNPPFYANNKDKDIVTYGGMRITSFDHFCALRALDCMKDDGRAAFLLDGTPGSRYSPYSYFNEDGEFQGEHKNFMNYLYSNYQVEDVISLNGHKLYSRQGQATNVRIVLINGRLPKQDLELHPPKYNPDVDYLVSTPEELLERVMNPKRKAITIKFDNEDKLIGKLQSAHLSKNKAQFDEAKTALEAIGYRIKVSGKKLQIENGKQINTAFPAIVLKEIQYLKK